MFPFDLSPAIVSAIAVVLVVLLGVAIWVATRDSDDDDAG